MTSLERELDSLILEIHRCTYEPQRWSSVLRRIGELLGADKANLITPGSNELVAIHGSDKDWLRDYRQQFAHKDMWLNGALKRGQFRSGVVAIDDELVKRKDFLRSEFYYDFLRHYDIDRAVCVCIHDGRSSGVPSSAISVFRGVGGAAFGRESAELLEPLIPHLQLALANYSRWAALATAQELSRQCLDALSAAMFAIGTRCQLMECNEAADRHLASGRFVRLDNGALRIGKACAEGEGNDASIRELACKGQSFSCELHTGIERAVLIGAPVSTDPAPAYLTTRASAVVWLIDERPSRTAVQVAARLFDLTPAEQRLLAKLMYGESLIDAAAASGIQPSTARTQLKSIFAKTGRSRQSDLIRLMHRISMIDL